MKLSQLSIARQSLSIGGQSSTAIEPEPTFPSGHRRPSRTGHPPSRSPRGTWPGTCKNHFSQIILCTGDQRGKVISPIVAVWFQLAVQGRSVFAVDRVNVALQAVPQIRDVRSPFEVARQIAQCNSEAGEHHHRDRQHGAEERAILKWKGKS